MKITLFFKGTIVLAEGTLKPTCTTTRFSSTEINVTLTDWPRLNI
nr:hypothetical protein [uncultured Bacteroides sp.]